MKDFSWKDCKIIVSISLLIIGQFIFSISFWFSLGRLYKNCMIISVDAEKASDKILYPLMIKKKTPPQKLGIEETHVNIIQAILNKCQETSFSMVIS